MPKSVLVVNPGSGKGEETPSLAAAARELGIDVRVLGAGEDAGRVAREADASVLGIAGGDGTVGALAAVAIECGLPFVCVPFGTRNHFARDLGLDLGDPVASLSAFTDGVPRAVDVGRAGDRVFVNNVSVGAYAQLVHRVRLRALQLTIDGAPVPARVALVANNAYRIDGVRERLDEGVLHLYVAHGLLRRVWEERVAERFTVAGMREVAIDGEPVRVDTPLEIAISPGALRMLVPRKRADG